MTYVFFSFYIDVTERCTKEVYGKPDKVTLRLFIDNEACTLGYNNFNNLALPRCWWLQNLIFLRHNYKTHFSFFEPFLPRLTSKLAKSVKMIKNLYFSKMQYGYQKRRIWCWFRIRCKSCKKTHAKKLSAKKWRKMECLTFTTVCISFQPIFLWVKYFAFFPTDSNSAYNCFLIPT